MKLLKEILKNKEELINLKFNKADIVFPGVVINLSSESINVLNYIEQYLQRYDRKIDFNIQYFNIIHISNELVLDELYKMQECVTEFETIKIHKNNSYIKKIGYNEIKLFYDYQKNYVVINKDNYYEVVTSNIKSEAIVLRIIREILFRSYENNKFILLHAAAVQDKDGRGIIICGEKAKGKTSCLLSYLNVGMKFVANDRVAVGVHNNKLYLIYIPLATRVGKGTINNIAKLKSAIYSDKKFTRMQNGLFFTDKSNEIGSKIKFELSTTEVSEIFGVDSIACCELKKCIFPEICFDNSGTEYSIVSKKSAFQILDLCTMTPYDDNWCNNWLIERKYTKFEFSLIKNDLLSLITKEIELEKCRFSTGKV
jgi:hypothetical protein